MRSRFHVVNERLRRPCTGLPRSCIGPFQRICSKIESGMTARSPSDTLVTVYGGSGLLGRHLVRALAKRHYRIRVAVRRPELAGYLQPLGRVGQIHAVQANVRHAESVEAAVLGADVVINLVGILFERGRQRFDTVQTYGAEQAALADR